MFGIWRTKPAIIGRDKVSNYEGGALALSIWGWGFIFEDPTCRSMIIGVEYRLIVEPCNNGLALHRYLLAIIMPVSHPFRQPYKFRDENLMTISNDIFTLMSIDILSMKVLHPPVTQPLHLSLCCHR
jgi:hypothetical protein